ncbi:MAG: aldehyde-activating protein [Pseudomonadota bacterium]
MNTEQASCYCENISVEVVFTDDLSAYSPRACDCDFCIKNGAAYISDPDGKLDITIKDTTEVSWYQQGANLVELLICKTCGVMVAVTYSDNGKRYAGLNSKTLANRDYLASSQVASPKLLSPAEKIKRWKEIWFSRVTITPQRHG